MLALDLSSFIECWRHEMAFLSTYGFICLSVRRYNLWLRYILCFISLLFILLVCLFIYLFICYCWSEGGVKVRRDMHSNLSATQPAQAAHQHRDRQRVTSSARVRVRGDHDTNFNSLDQQLLTESNESALVQDPKTGFVIVASCNLKTTYFVTPMCMLQLTDRWLSTNWPSCDFHQ